MTACTYHDAHHPSEGDGFNIGDDNHEREEAEARHELERAESQLEVSRPANPPLGRAAHRAEVRHAARRDLVGTCRNLVSIGRIIFGNPSPSFPAFSLKA